MEQLEMFDDQQEQANDIHVAEQRSLEILKKVSTGTATHDDALFLASQLGLFKQFIRSIYE